MYFVPSLCRRSLNSSTSTTNTIVLIPQADGIRWRIPVGLYEFFGAQHVFHSLPPEQLQWPRTQRMRSRCTTPTSTRPTVRNKCVRQTRDLKAGKGKEICVPTLKVYVGVELRRCGAPEHRRCGTPEHRRCGTPEHRRCGAPEHRRCGTPEHRRCGTPEHRRCGAPEHRRCGTPEHRRCGAPEHRRCGTSEHRCASSQNVLCKTFVTFDASIAWCSVLRSSEISVT